VHRRAAPQGLPQRARPRWLLVLAGCSLFIGAERMGILRKLEAPEDLARSVEAMGAAGKLAFLTGFAVLQPLGIPGSVFYLASALIWPFPIAFALSLVGSMAASTTGFTFARYALREFLTPRIPARFQRHNQALAERGFRTVFLLRFVLWTSPLLHAFLGLSQVRFGVHFYGSLCGYVVPVLTMTFFGRRVFSVLRAFGHRIENAIRAATTRSLDSCEAWPFWACGAALLVLLAWVALARQKRVKASKSGEEPAR
jgi:uncharacterized membrane protein YdjX (TVP38/TMEM64 family)